MLHPLMPREKREMDLRTGRRDDNSFAVETFAEVCMVRGQLTGSAHASPRRVAKKVLFAYEIPFSLQWNGSKARRDEERERFVGNSLVVTSWSLLNVVIVSCALRFLEFYFSSFTIVLGIFITDKCLN